MKPSRLLAMPSVRPVLAALLLVGAGATLRAQEAEEGTDGEARFAVPVDAPATRALDLSRTEADERIVYDITLEVPGRKIPLTARLPLEAGQTGASLTLSVQEREGRRVSSLTLSKLSREEEERTVQESKDRLTRLIEKNERFRSFYRMLYFRLFDEHFYNELRRLDALYDTARTNYMVRASLLAEEENSARQVAHMVPSLPLGLFSGKETTLWLSRTETNSPIEYLVEIANNSDKFSLSTNRISFAEGQSEIALTATANPSRLEALELRITREDDSSDRLRIALPIQRDGLAAFENNFYVCFIKKIPFGTREVEETAPDGTVSTRTEQIYKGRWHYITNGLRNTLTVALCAVLLGAVLGFLVAVVRTTHDKHGRLALLNAISKVYITVIRGTPMTVQLLIAYFIIFSNLNNKVLVAILAFGFNSGAYVAEIIRAGITSIDDGQMEAARSLGLSYGQGMRRIVLPQAIRNILPALGNEFIVMLKDTSIASFIGLDDLARGGSIIRSQTYQAYIPFLAVALIYLVMVMIFSKLLTRLEKHLHRTGN